MMVQFPESFITVLIVGALILCGASSIILIGLLIRDHKGGKVW